MTAKSLPCKLCLFILCLSICHTILGADSWNGELYAKNSSVQQSHAQRLLLSLSLQGDESILDLGCGDGTLTALLQEKTPRGSVLGIDPSDSMLAKARAQYPHITFLQDRAETFSLTKKFDHVIAIHVMHWIQNQEAALSNIYSHLKPGGQIHLILSPSKEGLPFHRALQKTLKTWRQEFEEFQNPQRVFSMDDYCALVRKAGFHITGCHYLYHESLHESKEALQRWIQQWLPHGKHLPMEKQPLFFQELMDHYLEEVKADPKSSSLSWGEYVLIIEGCKDSSTQ